MWDWVRKYIRTELWAPTTNLCCEYMRAGVQWGGQSWADRIHHHSGSCRPRMAPWRVLWQWISPSRLLNLRLWQIGYKQGMPLKPRALVEWMFVAILIGCRVIIVRALGIHSLFQFFTGMSILQCITLKYRYRNFRSVPLRFWPAEDPNRANRKRKVLKTQRLIVKWWSSMGINSLRL